MLILWPIRALIRSYLIMLINHHHMLLIKYLGVLAELKITPARFINDNIHYQKTEENQRNYRRTNSVGN